MLNAFIYEYDKPHSGNQNDEKNFFKLKLDILSQSDCSESSSYHESKLNKKINEIRRILNNPLDDKSSFERYERKVNELHDYLGQLKEVINKKETTENSVNHLKTMIDDLEKETENYKDKYTFSKTFKSTTDEIIKSRKKGDSQLNVNDKLSDLKKIAEVLPDDKIKTQYYYVKYIASKGSVSRADEIFKNDKGEFLDLSKVKENLKNRVKGTVSKEKNTKEFVTSTITSFLYKTGLKIGASQKTLDDITKTEEAEKDSKNSNSRTLRGIKR